VENVMNIEIPYPDAAELHLRIAVGACQLFVVPGDGPQWVSGTYEDSTGAAPLRLEQDGGTAVVTQSFNWPEKGWSVDRPPRFHLALGKAKVYALTLEVGANEGVVELGGLPITCLTLKHGAGKQTISFSAPNPQPMSLFNVAAGAAEVTLINLANANFAEMSLEGGAAAYSLDFGGALQRDAQIKIVTGMAGVEICVPGATAAKIVTATVLGGVSVGDGFMKREGAFWTEAALAGKTPSLTISANVTMGGIRLSAEG
jgi:hypothetical protein